MMRRYPPETRAAAIDAYRTGSRVNEIAADTGISGSLISYWIQRAGLNITPRCSVCAHPQRHDIDEALLDNSVADVAARFDVTTNKLSYHRRTHLGITGIGTRGINPCPACIHPQRRGIDTMLRQGVNRPTITQWLRQTPAGTAGVTEAGLRHHMRAGHIDNQTHYARLDDIANRRTAARRQIRKRRGEP